MSIKTVAGLAGVSTATISRALQNSGNVSPQTRQRVFEAVRASGYQANTAARNLRTRQSRALLILVPSIANPFFSPIIQAAEQVASQRNYNVLLGDTGGDADKEAHLARMLITAQVDGVIQLNGRWPGSLDGTGERIAPRSRFINACELFEDAGISSISIDNHAAAAAMVRHLLADGHREIALLTGPTDSRLTMERTQGALAALAAARLRPTTIMAGDYSMQSGSSTATAIVSRPRRPTAIFCFNDEMAIGAIHQLRALGYGIPDDISVAGFDDIEVARYCSPGLTTVVQPKAEIGAQAARMLIDRIEGRATDVQQIVLGFSICTRASTGPVAPGARGPGTRGS